MRTRAYGPDGDGRGGCSYCGRRYRLEVVGAPGTEVVVRHGPRSSPCPGSGYMPAGDTPGAQAARAWERVQAPE